MTLFAKKISLCLFTVLLNASFVSGMKRLREVADINPRSLKKMHSDKRKIAMDELIQKKSNRLNQKDQSNNKITLINLPDEILRELLLYLDGKVDDMIPLDFKTQLALRVRCLVCKKFACLIVLSYEIQCIKNYLGFSQESIDNHLIVASQEGDISLVKQLIYLGAKVNCYDAYFGQSPLHYCAQNGNAQLVALLLKQGADPNARDYKGQTPLHVVGSKGYGFFVGYGIAKLLYNYGANIWVKDHEGARVSVLKEYLKDGLAFTGAFFLAVAKGSHLAESISISCVDAIL